MRITLLAGLLFIAGFMRAYALPPLVWGLPASIPAAHAAQTPVVTPVAPAASVAQPDPRLPSTNEAPQPTAPARGQITSPQAAQEAIASDGAQLHITTWLLVGSSLLALGSIGLPRLASRLKH